MCEENFLPVFSSTAFLKSVILLFFMLTLFGVKPLVPPYSTLKGKEIVNAEELRFGCIF